MEPIESFIALAMAVLSHAEADEATVSVPPAAGPHAASRVRGSSSPARRVTSLGRGSTGQGSIYGG